MKKSISKPMTESKKSTDAHRQLDTYRKKRRFDVTPEPEGAAQNKAPAAQALFVVQKHAARRLHYDFRLELDGTLKSWAVPKGPSLDPSIKRMAVQVEDHPLSYAEFEGTIPAGNYGAGTVIVWDIGTWHCEGDPLAAYQKGHLRFELRGKKLRGHWHLVRTRGRNGDKETWLLIKQADGDARALAQYDIVDAQPDSVLQGAGAKRALRRKQGATDHHKPGTAAPQPLMLAPQLATLVDTPPRGGNWIYEVKFDGYRVLARINARDGVHLFTRNGHDWTQRLKPLAQAIASRGWCDTWLDGEIVMFDSHGISHFQRLQNAFEQNATQPIVYMLFDLLYYRGRDLRALPLHARRELLREIMAANDNPHLRFSDHIDADHEDVFDLACRMHIEGLIGKRADSIYKAGRTRDWIKLKCLQRQEFVIGGYTDARNQNVRAIGALLLGVHDEQLKLRYVGKVGTGFSQQSALELHEKLQSRTIAKSSFSETVRQPGVHWVKPSLLAEIAFAAWTDDGHIRHSSFQGLRADKPAEAIRREVPVNIDTTDKTTKTSSASSKVSTRAKRAGALAAGTVITHPERVIDARSGATKLDLIHYYETAAPQLLAHLKDRPVSLVRAPTGVGGELFFQKHSGNLHIPALIEVDPALLPNHPPLISINSLDALIQCAQMNVVEFHTWNARLDHIEQPDRMVFDLDPGEGIVWPQIIEAAQLMKAALDELKLKSYLKTSGGKGLHIVVPLAPRDDWQHVRDFSEKLVRHLAQTLPQLFVATSGPKNRLNRIFIDYLRNNRGSTTAAAFSARLRPGLGVSVPVAWGELSKLSSSTQWHIGNLNAREIAARAACWTGYARVKQTLTHAYKTLGALT
jgi:bifunctional non-homologous end joining protein LigD